MCSIEYEPFGSHFSDVAGGVRGLCQPSGSVHILFSLRAQYDCALRVEDRPFQGNRVQSLNHYKLRQINYRFTIHISVQRGSEAV